MRTQHGRIDESLRTLPEGTVAFDRALRGFVTDLYRASAGSEPQYFVDKTPRYHLIAHDVVHLFPEAKFIYLWRNPISVASSMMRSWGEGRWNLFRYWIDLEYGPGNLVEAYFAHAETAIAIQYEELIRDPQSASRQVFEYLGLHYRSEVLGGFGSVELVGSMGDHTGMRYGSSISTDSLTADSEMLGSPVRKAWLRQYLGRLGDDTLEAMGYQRGSLLQFLSEVPNSFRTVPGDLLRMAYGAASWTFDSVVEWRTKRYLHGAGRTPINPPPCRPEDSE
jgi:Sulfotransferase family